MRGRRLRRRPVRPVFPGRVRGRLRLRVRPRAGTYRRSSSRSSVLRVLSPPVRRRLRVCRSRPLLRGRPVGRRRRVAGCTMPRRCSPTRASAGRTRRVLRGRPVRLLLPVLRVLRVRVWRRRLLGPRLLRDLRGPRVPRVLRALPVLRAVGSTMPRRCWRVRVRVRPVPGRRSLPVLRGLPVRRGRVRTRRRLRAGTAIRSSRRVSRRSVRGIRPCSVSARRTAASSS